MSESSLEGVHASATSLAKALMYMWNGYPTGYARRVRACMAYMTRWGSRPGPFFHLEDGTPLTKAIFISQVKKALLYCTEASLYSGHSFRIRVATSTAHAGIQNNTIKTLRRWLSAAFMTYIRTPRHQLAEFSASLAQQQFLGNESFD